MNNSRREAATAYCDECERTPLNSIHPENKRDRELSQQTVLLIKTVCEISGSPSFDLHTICNIIYSVCGWDTTQRKH